MHSNPLGEGHGSQASNNMGAVSLPPLRWQPMPSLSLNPFPQKT